jgi:hypothetical protein
MRGEFAARSQTFLKCLGTFFASYPVFWNGNRLSIERDLRKKLASFPIQDPTVNQLASSGGKASALLFRMFEDHVNSGKRTKRLVPRAEAHQRRPSST